MLRFITPDDSANVADTLYKQRDIIRWINTVSSRIEQYLNRAVQIAATTEYFDPAYGQKEFFPKAFPITALTSVYYDSTGLWTGSETEITNCFIGTNSRSVCLPAFVGNEKNSIRIIYTGGLTSHGTNSTYAISTSAGTWHTGKYVKGSSSSAMGIVRTASATSLTVEVLYGVFQAAETITEMDSEASVGSADAVATISSVTTSSLAETYPDITTACEMQVRYMWQNRYNFEKSSVQKDGVSQRPQVLDIQLPLQPEVISLLSPYKRLIV
jgi:hypothetical protein